MKKFTLLDIIFLSFAAIFAALSIYEFVRFIIPHYSFLRAIIIFICISFWYYLFKTWGNIELLQKWWENNFRKYKNSTNKLQHIQSLVKYKEMIAYWAFIVLFVAIIISMLLDSNILLSWAVWIFFILYFFLKLFGFKLQLNLKKSDLGDVNALRFFLITFALFIVSITLMFNSFGIQWVEEMVWYIILSGIYILSGIILFFSFNGRKKSIFSVYNILSVGLVSILLLILIYQRVLVPYLEQQDKKTATMIEETTYIASPLIEEDTASKNIYETKIIGDIYDITPGLLVGSQGKDVSDLQKVLLSLEYYREDITGQYDENTRVALSSALIQECKWETAQWIFGPQAKECIENLEILIPQAIETWQ